MKSCTTGRYVNTKTGEYFDESKLGLLMAQGPVENGAVQKSLTEVPVLTEKYTRRAQGNFPAERQREYFETDRLQPKPLGPKPKDRITFRESIDEINDRLVLANRLLLKGMTVPDITHGERKSKFGIATKPLITQDHIWKIKDKGTNEDLQTAIDYFGLYYRNMPRLDPNQVRQTVLRFATDPTTAKVELYKYIDSEAGKEKTADIYGQLGFGIQFLESMTGLKFHPDHILPAVKIKNIFSGNDWFRKWNQTVWSAIKNRKAHEHNLSVLLDYENTKKGNREYREKRAIGVWDNLFGSAYSEVGYRNVDLETSFILTFDQNLKEKLGFSLADKNGATRLMVYLHNNVGMTLSHARLLAASLTQRYNISNHMIKLERNKQKKAQAAADRYIGRI